MAFRMASTAAPFTRLAGKGAVQVDDVQVLEALGFERFRLIGRVIVEDGRLAHLAELEPHAFSVLQVDHREEDHSYLSRRRCLAAGPCDRHYFATFVF